MVTEVDLVEELYCGVNFGDESVCPRVLYKYYIIT